ncbi:MAG: hypothetical protein SFV17_11460 [Candidatus Obscuribacter sp.]|nr:hypothetical protein [Candidatus Obscuribacter sp.]
MKNESLNALLRRLHSLARYPESLTLPVHGLQAEFLPELPPNVTHLILTQCNIRHLRRISSSVVFLSMSGCTVSSLQPPPCVERMFIRDCHGFKWLPEMPRSLKELSLKGLELRELPVLNRGLEKLALSNLHHLGGELILSQTIRQLDLYDCPGLTGRLCLPDSVETVDMGKCPGIDLVSHRNLMLSLSS